MDSGIANVILFVRNTAFMSNTSKVGRSRPKTPCLLPVCILVPFIYFSSLALSDRIALLGSTALLAKARI